MAQPAAVAGAVQRVLAFSALRQRDYRKYFIAGVLAMTGDLIEHVISYWVIFQAFHSPALAGFAVISHWLPSSYTGHTRGHAPARRVPGIGLREAGRVFREVSVDRRIAIMIVLGGVTSLLVGNAFQAQMPEYAHHFGADEGGFQYSALLAANAAGAITGAPLLESAGFLQPKVRTAIACAALWSLAIGLFPAASSYGIALGILFLAGGLNIAFAAMAQTLVQLFAPPALRGRVVGLFNMASLGLRAGSGVSVGVLGGFIGIYWSLGLSAAALLLVALGLLVFDVVASR